jgi:hypothetical protein
MKLKSTTVDGKIEWAVAGELVDASVRHEVERALEAYDIGSSAISDARINDTRRSHV